MFWVDAIEGELLRLHVVPDLLLRWLDHLAITFIDQSRLESADEDRRAEGQRTFSTWLPSQAHERCRTLAVVGDAAGAIIEVAQVKAADVIIMWAPKRRWWPVLAGSVTDTVMRRAPVPVVVWAGVEQMSCRGCWKGVRHPHKHDAPGQGGWRDWSRARWERTPILKSW